MSKALQFTNRARDFEWSSSRELYGNYPPLCLLIKTRISCIPHSANFSAPVKHHYKFVQSGIILKTSYNFSSTKDLWTISFICTNLCESFSLTLLNMFTSSKSPASITIGIPHICTCVTTSVQQTVIIKNMQIAWERYRQLSAVNCR